MTSAASFSSDYYEARAKFRREAEAAGGRLEIITHPERGPDGLDLSTDVAAFGRSDAERFLVLISGTHGVEGFCGSGAQIDFLRRGEVSRLPADLAVLMIHAINPFGFAWLRRTNEHNIDLNRNWIDFTAPIPDNGGYDALHHAFCPPEWSEASRTAASQDVADYVKRQGSDAMIRAVTSGQYRHPTGLFYGGLEASWSRTTQIAIFERYLGGADAVGIIDYHTGLGPWGFAEQIITSGRDTDMFRRAAQWYGGALASVVDGTSASARVAGDGLSAAPALLPEAAVTAIALEFGTYPQPEMVVALQADAWLHAHGDLASEQGREIKRQVRTAFYPDTDEWKGMVAGQSLLVCRQAIAGLARSHG